MPVRDPSRNAVSPHVQASDETGLEADVRDALERLTALHEGYAGVLAVIALGQRAVAPLKAILNHTESSGIFEIRIRAITALCALRADAVLIDFIEGAHPIADPTARAGEDAALSIAARALTGSRDPRAFPVLLRLARRRPLPGVIEALAAARRVQAIPALIQGLGEDDARAAAAEGLKVLGRLSRKALIDVARAGDETEGGLRKRRAAMRVLADIGVGAGERHHLRRLIDSPDSELRLYACRALSNCGNAADRAACRRHLLKFATILQAPLKTEAIQPRGRRTVAPSVTRANGSNPTRQSRPQRPILHLPPSRPRPGAE